MRRKCDFSHVNIVSSYFHVTQLGEVVVTPDPLGEGDSPEIVISNCPDRATALWCWRAYQADILERLTE